MGYFEVIRKKNSIGLIKICI